MKKIITTTILFCCVAFYINAQFLIEPEPAPKINFSFSPHYISTLPNGVRPLKQSALANPSLISDVVEGFPVNWIGKYLEMEISTISNGKLIKCSSTDDHLNEKQKNLLKSLQIGDDFMVDVTYNYINTTSQKMERGYVNTTLTIVPEKEAEYYGDQKLIDNYITTTCLKKLTTIKANVLSKNRAEIIFTVNEKGNVVKAYINKSSHDAEIDALFLKAISEMPSWKPAENNKGEKITQNFKFFFGNFAGGC